jgi:hypothetical protein
MRTSRTWIEQTVRELEALSSDPAAPADANERRRASRAAASDLLSFEVTLSPEELEALAAICDADELSPKQALSQIVRARLMGEPQFSRPDRTRLRACLDLLRALEQHIGRAARPAATLKRTPLGREVLVEELVELGAYLHAVGNAIGEAMRGNLEYWQGETPAAQPAPQSNGSRAA